MRVWFRGWTVIHWHKRYSHVCIYISRIASKINHCVHSVSPFINWFKQWVISFGSKWFTKLWISLLSDSGRWWTLIRSQNYSAKVFEEEDYDPRDYGYILTPDITATKACFLLKEAEEELLKKPKPETEIAEVSKWLSFFLRSWNIHLYLVNFTAHSGNCIPFEVCTIAVASIECTETEQKHFAEWTGNEWNRSLAKRCRRFGTVH